MHVLFHNRSWLARLAAATMFVFAPAAMAGAQERTTTQSGLIYIDTETGEGEMARAGDTAEVHYTGWLYQGGQKGRKFDSSHDRGQTFSFPLGVGRVIRGWDEGVAGMREGGKRTLIVPPELGYGRAGAGGVIPPNSTLLFEVELIDVK